MKKITHQNHRKTHRRSKGLLALSLAAALLAATVPVGAAEEISDGVNPTCDEAYYATLDYYGNLKEASVVKSYALNGATSLTDYGTYDNVQNLTDGTSAQTGNGTVTFDFGASAPDHFYFEGKTASPFETLPWTLSVNYTLNGVATKAEDLAGKTGVVEIKIDAVPNEAASDYAKNNYTLEAMAVFNQNDILSLEADGAQVQLLGNLRMVLFLAMPGEEQHFLIRVGSNDFSFDGMTFLMVPATLSQLDQIASLSDRKDDIEKNYDKLSSSMDTLLDSVGDMSSSLNDTAKGLDELDQARETIASGKNSVYAQADTAIGDLRALSDALSSVTGHLTTASQAVNDVSDDLTKLTNTAVSVKTNLNDTKETLTAMQKDLSALQKLTGTTSSNSDLKTHLTRLGSELKDLQNKLDNLKTSISNMNLTINGNVLNGVDSTVASNVKVNGTTLKDLRDKVNGLNSLYQAAGAGSALSEQQFFTAVLMYKGESAAEAAASAQQLAYLIATVDTQLAALSAEEQQAMLGGLDAAMGEGTLASYQQGKMLDKVYQTAGSGSALDKTAFFTAMLMLADIQADASKLEAVLGNKGGYQSTAKEMMGLYQDYALSDATNGLLDDLSELCALLGTNGLTSDVAQLSSLSGNAIKDLNALADNANQILDITNSTLDQVKALDDTVNGYVPDLQATLADTQKTVGVMTTTLSDTSTFLTSFKSLSKKTGTQLNTGTKDTLTGLASTLRKAAKSLDTAGDVKAAKDSIDSVVRDVWGDYSGKVNNLLSMDATAAAQSLTSQQNAAPQSVQILIRTQEIKAGSTASSDTQSGDSAQSGDTAASSSNSNSFWSRVKSMFHGLWSGLTSIF